MLIVNCRTDLWCFYNVHDTSTVIVSNVYSFYVSSVGLGRGLVLQGPGLGHLVSRDLRPDLQKILGKIPSL